MAIEKMLGIVGDALHAVGKFLVDAQGVVVGSSHGVPGGVSGWLIATWGLMTGIVWLLAMLMGLLGGGYDFSYAGWAVGIALVTYIFWQDRQDDRTGQTQNESTGSQDPL